MENQNIKELIEQKWFDNFQNGLSARFAANNINYEYHYEEDKFGKLVIVKLNKDGISCLIKINEKGILSFDYGKVENYHIERFKNCTSEDFHTMIAYAFLYIRDGNFYYHKEWYDNLEK